MVLDGFRSANKTGKAIQHSASEMTSDSCPGTVEAEKYWPKTANSKAAPALAVVGLVNFMVLLQT